MKTNFKNLSVIKRNIFFLLSTFLLSQTSTKAGNDDHLKNICVDNFSIMSTVSGNGFGLHYSPTVGVRFGDRTVISGGPVFKSSNLSPVGATGNVRVTVMHPDESFCGKTSLYFFGSFERCIRQSFSKNWIDVEELVSRREINVIDFASVRFTGFEAAGGFGVGYNILPRFSLNADLGLSVYKVKRMNYDSINLYHQPKGMNVHFSLTARFNLSAY